MHGKLIDIERVEMTALSILEDCFGPLFEYPGGALDAERLAFAVLHVAQEDNETDDVMGRMRKCGDLVMMARWLNRAREELQSLGEAP